MADRPDGTGREGDPNSSAPVDIGTPLARERAKARDGGDGGGSSADPMESRVTRLETHLEYIQRDIADLKSGQTRVLDIVQTLATKRDLWAWKWQWTTLAFAVVAIVIGGIIGGLGWIKPTASPTQPQPIVIRIPR